MTEETNVCKFCNKPFKKLSTLSVHVCEPKRRHLAKNDKHVMVGFETFVRFYQLTQANQSTLKERTYDDFAKSPYYNAFVKFGSFVHNIKPLYPSKFIEWIIKSGVKLDCWCSDALYERYVLELLQTESVNTALERSITTMMQWAETNNSRWDHYFKYINTNRAIFDIKDGKISPWLILNCGTGTTMLTSFRDDQLASISTIIDPVFWKKRFKNSPVEMKLVCEVVINGNL